MIWNTMNDIYLNRLKNKKMHSYGMQIGNLAYFLPRDTFLTECKISDLLDFLPRDTFLTKCKISDLLDFLSRDAFLTECKISDLLDFLSKDAFHNERKTNFEVDFSLKNVTYVSSICIPSGMLLSVEKTMPNQPCIPSGMQPDNFNFERKHGKR